MSTVKRSEESLLIDLEVPEAKPRRAWRPPRKLPRKEVIQPHLPVRLPCYDFTPITNPTLDVCLYSEE